MAYKKAEDGKWETAMLDSAIQNELLKELEQLSLPMQRKVVEFAHSLTGSIPRGTPGNQLLRFAGTMTEAEAKEMMDAIEDCERVDPNEW